MYRLVDKTKNLYGNNNEAIVTVSVHMTYDDATKAQKEHENENKHSYTEIQYIKK